LNNQIKEKHKMKDIADLIARIFLAFIFLYDAYDSSFYFQTTKAKMINYGLTWQTHNLLILAIFLLVVGGILLLTGYRSKFGALLLMIYYIPLTLIVHDFWNIPPECIISDTCEYINEEFRRLQITMFMKNLAIIGGLLTVFVNGSGRWSIKRLFATTKVPGY